MVKLNKRFIALYKDLFDFLVACAIKQSIYYFTGLWTVCIRIFYHCLFMIETFYTWLPLTVAILFFVCLIIAWPMFLYIIFFAKDRRGTFMKIFIFVAYVALWTAASCFINASPRFSDTTRCFSLSETTNVFMLLHIFLPIELGRRFFLFLPPMLVLYIIKFINILFFVFIYELFEDVNFFIKTNKVFKRLFNKEITYEPGTSKKFNNLYKCFLIIFLILFVILFFIVLCSALTAPTCDFIMFVILAI